MVSQSWRGTLDGRRASEGVLAALNPPTSVIMPIVSSGDGWENHFPGKIQWSALGGQGDLSTMSLPPDLRDQLLSGYLDDSLSRDERARVETLLENDPTAAAELAELRELRQSIQCLARVDHDHQFEPGFADRVLTAAIKQAQQEGIPETHPLRKVFRAAGAGDHKNVSRFPIHYAAALLALAASVVLAVVMLRPDPAAGPEVATLALAEIDEDSSVPETLSVEQESRGTQNTDMLAVAETPEPATTLPESSDPAVLADPADQSLPQASTAQTADAPTIAVAPATEAPTPSRPLTAKPSTQIGAILVVEVRLTERGRSDNAIRRAMERAGIDASSQRELSPELIGHLSRTQNVATDEVESTVMYLQAGAKKLDQLYLHLLADEQGVESCGMSLATGAPILSIVASVSVEPTTVQHADHAIEFSGRSDVMDGLAGELSQLPFTPLNRDSIGAVASSGRDVPAQILLLVR